MSAYEAQRLENIQRNQALLKDLGLHKNNTPTKRGRDEAIKPPPPSKKRKVSTPLAPTRSSARLAAATTKPNYSDDAPSSRSTTITTANKSRKKSSTSSKPSRRTTTTASTPTIITTTTPITPEYLDLLHKNWYDWTPSSPPTRDPLTSKFHFPSHPTFQPNKHPLEILREGSFGGSYYRPIFSRTLALTIANDHTHLPPTWLTQLNPETQLLRETYDAETNKYGVKCGQSIEEWEGNGWINAEWDVRGWFQWYERFFRGRRGQDDERQVGRWERCVGERGRWRRALVKQYLKRGVRDVADEGLDGEVERDVSPVLSQTCFHWAYEMTQADLDKAWEEGL